MTINEDRSIPGCGCVNIIIIKTVPFVAYTTFIVFSEFQRSSAFYIHSFRVFQVFVLVVVFSILLRKIFSVHVLHTTQVTFSWFRCNNIFVFAKAISSLNNSFFISLQRYFVSIIFSVFAIFVTTFTYNLQYSFPILKYYSFKIENFKVYWWVLFIFITIQWNLNPNKELQCSVHDRGKSKKNLKNQHCKYAE